MLITPVYQNLKYHSSIKVRRNINTSTETNSKPERAMIVPPEIYLLTAENREWGMQQETQLLLNDDLKSTSYSRRCSRCYELRFKSKGYIKRGAAPPPLKCNISIKSGVDGHGDVSIMLEGKLQGCWCKQD